MFKMLEYKQRTCNGRGNNIILFRQAHNIMNESEREDLKKNFYFAPKSTIKVTATAKKWRDMYNKLADVYNDARYDRFLSPFKRRLLHHVLNKVYDVTMKINANDTGVVSLNTVVFGEQEHKIYMVVGQIGIDPEVL